MTLRYTLRNLILSESDRHILSVGKFFAFPEKFLLPNLNIRCGKCNCPGSDTRFSLESISINIDGFDLAWIQNIVLDTAKNQLEIGHFALAKEITGFGLGKRLAFALQNVANSEFGVKQILFKESSQNPMYPIFFTSKLGAKEVEAFPAGKDWLWIFK